MRRSQIVLFTIILAACLCALACNAVKIPSDNEVRLEKFCGGTYILPCPESTEADRRAGRLGFLHVPKRNCSVVLAMPSDCTTESAIYLHIPVSYIGQNQTLEIFETKDDQLELIKQIPGGEILNIPNSPFLSVAQVRSRYDRTPSLTIFIGGGPQQKDNPYHEIWMDYTLLTSESSKLPNEALCEALEGYIPKAIMCNDADTGRVSCPEAYVERLDPNSVLEVQRCDEQDCTWCKPDHSKSTTNEPGTTPPTTRRPPETGTTAVPPVEVQHVDLSPTNGKGTVTFVLKPLSRGQSFYRILLGEIILYVKDREVCVGEEGPHDYMEKRQRSPVYSLIHPNCSQITHWVTFSSRREGDIPPFIKFGWGYHMTSNVLFEFASTVGGNHDQPINNIGRVAVCDNVALVDAMKKQDLPLLLDYSPVIIKPKQRTREHTLSKTEIFLTVASQALIGDILENIEAEGSSGLITPEELSAINYSLETPGCTLAKILEAKTKNLVLAVASRLTSAFHPSPNSVHRARSTSWRYGRRDISARCTTTETRPR
ncbi:uncharacterized protein LOC129600476 isoform X2 [Paramacrobiotus metropolitanus]|uniref:uncharacterized protein LOC129600476 isoform X2 n=1 Tax=Paramacrobiotus metropolitanus TaxID=2943436 RepID=UPI0024457D85|nr:uncharacterized protein LOC129600476 isoform X2 [Paramacrobiotus metropolitanus]